MFDYAIIGLGAAGMQLALQMAEDPFFDTKKIAIIDKSRDSMPKKTWCFWEQGKGKWDHLVEKKWHETLFIGPAKNMKLPLESFQYKMLKSEAFYEYAFNFIAEKKQFTLIFDEVSLVEEKQDVVEISTKNQKIKAKHVFDSCVPPQFFEKHEYINIPQHFKGWFIKTDAPVFNENQFTMMDFSVAHQNATSFMYVLPFSKTSALLEYTFFCKDHKNEPLYDQLIGKYIAEKYPSVKNYEIIETEMGVIPMSTYPFEKHHTKKITKIGTAGGWVRPSTGYSFKNGEFYSKKIIRNIKQAQPITENLYAKRFLFYDRLLLDIINSDNSKGPQLFEVLFSKNSIEKALLFLDGKTSFKDELKIMASYPPLPFMKAMLRQFLS